MASVARAPPRSRTRPATRGTPPKASSTPVAARAPGPSADEGSAEPGAEAAACPSGVDEVDTAGAADGAGVGAPETTAVRVGDVAGAISTATEAWMKSVPRIVDPESVTGPLTPPARPARSNASGRRPWTRHPARGPASSSGP
ncbi:hypothetical protein C5E10_03205 [Pseudoclavibacter sp. RFBG4]|nr:hypothetical protein C5E10_03205 [Pseudoclavibacter sp. RFBG4]